MQLVKESVHLDWDQQKIICTLPVRGEETLFFTSNKDLAQKVLDQQCRKWYKDKVNKDLIVAAFEKLLKTGDTKFMDQLRPD